MQVSVWVRKKAGSPLETEVTEGDSVAALHDALTVSRLLFSWVVNGPALFSRQGFQDQLVH